MFAVRSQLRDTIDASIFPTAAAHRTPTLPFNSSTTGDNGNGRDNNDDDDDNSKRPRTNSLRLELFQLVGTLYNWVIWAFMFALLMSQVLGVVWNSSTSHMYVDFGRSPELGFVAITGSSDYPYSDRSVACVLSGRQYKPMQLRQALLLSSTATIDSSGALVNGFRVIERNDKAPDQAATFANTCDTIASTLDSIVDSCAALGYNVTDDTLRIVDGLNSSSLKLIANTLPVLIVPYSDKSVSARYVIPGHDGSACVFRLEGMYELETEMQGFMRAVSRDVRETKTVEWLNQPNGQWRNGWYEDATGARWFADLVSTTANSTFSGRLFDTSANAELDCANTSACAVLPRKEVWGTKLTSTISTVSVTSVLIANGAQLGLKWLELHMKVVVMSEYDLETLISNVALGFVMIRWLVCMAALGNGHRRGVTRWSTIGIGSIACARNFHFLPIMLMPRLKTTLAALFTAGCNFQGSQSSLSENWFVMYPAVCEFMLFYYSLLNMIAKMLRRRVSDALFGPTLLVLCLLHYQRSEIASAGWFGITDSKVPTVVQSSEFASLRLAEYFSSNVALRLNGNLTSLFTVKLVLVALNVLPLVVCSQNTSRRSLLAKRHAACDVEKALAIRAPFVGGLGRSAIYEAPSASGTTALAQHHSDAVAAITTTTNANGKRRRSSATPTSALSSYELVRIGYVVLGGTHLISIADWHTLFFLAPLRFLRQPPNFRVTLFTLVEHETVGRTTRVTIDDYPHVCRLNDPRLQSVSVFDITARPLY